MLQVVMPNRFYHIAPLVVFWLCAGPVQAQTKGIPRFKDFRVDRRFSGAPAAPKLSQPRARLYRSTIREQVSAGPNFAGHYTLARWSCGPNCVSFAIVETRTGRLYLHPTLKYAHVVADQDEDVLQFRLDSQLLVVVGARNGQGSGRYYYKWDGERLRLIRAKECKFNLEAEPKTRCPS
jgi:hypothetical protein